MQKYSAELVIVGGGASGMLAAIRAAVRLKENKIKPDILLLEGNSRVGKKLLATGNGRCNISNRNLFPGCYYGDREQLAEILQRCDIDRVLGTFEEMGLLFRTDDAQRVYPSGFQASTVQKLLRAACEYHGVRTVCDFAVTAVKKNSSGYLLTAETGERAFASRLILACGGKAAPKLNCQSMGYALAESLGHKVQAILPALTPLCCEEVSFTKALKGMRCKVNAVLNIDGVEAVTSEGEVIFSQGSISGICIFDLSAYLADYMIARGETELEKGRVKLILDVAAPWSISELVESFKRAQKRLPELPVMDMLSGITNSRVGEAIVKKSLKNINRPISDLSVEELNGLAKALKCLSFNIIGLGDWSQAQVTAGGIKLKEIDQNSMESKLNKGLYFSGEMLNATGICGGYNLQFAWATGILAGESVAESLILHQMRG